MVRVRRGAVLLEAIVAMTILGTVGAAIVALAADSARAIERAAAADRAIVRASAFLDAVVLWPREDLDRHLGTRDEGPWRMTVGRPTPTVYTVALADSTDRHVILSTVIFRAHAP